jgi:hypothetical protein
MPQPHHVKAAELHGAAAESHRRAAELHSKKGHKAGLENAKKAETQSTEAIRPPQRRTAPVSRSPPRLDDRARVRKAAPVVASIWVA